MEQSFSRRMFLLLAGGLATAPSRIPLDEGIPSGLDHILLGASDLDSGIAFLEEKSGVRPMAGGSHPGAGTRNALLSLGTERYLEVIAPDPQQNSAPAARYTGLAGLRAPKLIGWAVHTHNIAVVAEKLREEGIAADGPSDGSRQRPDGVLLRWKTLRLENDRNGLLPFFIEWGANTTHPSVDAPGGCRLVSFAAVSSNPAELQAMFRRIGVELNVKVGATQQLSARFESPHGEFTLTS
jgi:Glyoxalase-like domain